MKLDLKKHRAGILAPVFALRTASDFGIGDTGGVRALIQWCAENGLSVIQVLPINETSDDNSPYNTISSLALDPTTLEISEEAIPGLTQNDIQEIATPKIRSRILTGPVKYSTVKKLKRDLLCRAYQHFENEPQYETLRAEFQKYYESEKHWIETYSHFRTLLEFHSHPNWEIWPVYHRTPEDVLKWLPSLNPEEFQNFHRVARFHSYVQWILNKQWSALRIEAEGKGVYLMGDIPFGVSRHSADVWANPTLFDLDWSVGAPPEPFFCDNKFTKVWGQNWGMPLYYWGAMKKDNYAWWRNRVHGVARYFHLFRIDHVLGFFRVYAFPWHPKDNDVYVDMTQDEVKEKLGDLPHFIPGNDNIPEQAKTNEVIGTELLKVIIEAAGDSTVIAEDLGVVPNYVRPSLEKLGISGFKIPLFERFEDSREYKNPAEYSELSISTLATHDHETMKGIWEHWWRLYEEGEQRRKDGTLDPKFENEARYASWEIYRTQRFCRLDDRIMLRNFEPAIREGLCTRLFESKSWLAILMIADIFGLNIRFNVPGPVADSNWSERMPFEISEMSTRPDLLERSQFIRNLSQKSGRD